MDALNTFIALISKTDGRDKFLRLIQYASLHSVEHKTKGPIHNLYKQIRMTRKILRFLRTLQYSSKMREEAPEIKKKFERGDIKKFFFHLVSFLQNLFNFLFFISDHRVCLAELGVISKQTGDLHYPKSMKYYLLQNVFGVLKNIMNLSIIIVEGKKQKLDGIKVVSAIKKASFDLIRCLFDCVVALYYWKGGLPANKVGILGVITSLMAIRQVLELM